MCLEVVRMPHESSCEMQLNLVVVTYTVGSEDTYLAGAPNRARQTRCANHRPRALRRAPRATRRTLGKYKSILLQSTYIGRFIAVCRAAYRIGIFKGKLDIAYVQGHLSGLQTSSTQVMRWAQDLGSFW